MKHISSALPKVIVVQRTAGQTRFWRNTRRGLVLVPQTGWYKRGGIFWFRIFGWGLYRIRGERPYLLRPGKPPKRTERLLSSITPE